MRELAAVAVCVALAVVALAPFIRRAESDLVRLRRTR